MRLAYCPTVLLRISQALGQAPNLDSASHPTYSSGINALVQRPHKGGDSREDDDERMLGSIDVSAFCIISNHTKVAKYGVVDPGSYPSVDQCIRHWFLLDIERFRINETTWYMFALHKWLKFWRQ
jgi:hypothetical protein